MPSVLYVTDTRHGDCAWHDPSARHRCYHFADALLAESCRASVVHIERLTTKLAGQFQHVIFHRPKSSKRFLKALALCKRAGMSIHADYDDLIFKPDLAASSPLYINGNRPLQKVEAYFSDNRRALLNFENIFVSTRTLAAHVRSVVPDATVTVLPNSLPRLFQQPRARSSQNESFTIGYFPGSNSHAHDMELIDESLVELFKQEPGCKLVVMGRLDAANVNVPLNFVEFKAFVDYNQYLAQLAQVDLSIAPLQSNIFNEAKSAVKLIESVAVGTPILSSDNPDMQDHHNPMSAVVEDGVRWVDMLLKCARGRAGFDCTVKDQLKQAYSVTSRLPVLQQAIGATA